MGWFKSESKEEKFKRLMKGASKPEKTQLRAYRKVEKQREARKIVGVYKEQPTTASSVTSGFFDRMSRLRSVARAPPRVNIRASTSAHRSPGGLSRGRPAGSVKYSIPGVGPVGVYEFRKWQSTQNQIAKLNARNQSIQNIQAMRSQAQQRMNPQSQYPGEQNTIPNTQGKVSMSNYQKEVEDAANAFP